MRTVVVGGALPAVTGSNYGTIAGDEITTIGVLL